MIKMKSQVKRKQVKKEIKEDNVKERNSQELSVFLTKNQGFFVVLSFFSIIIIELKKNSFLFSQTEGVNSIIFLLIFLTVLIISLIFIYNSFSNKNIIIKILSWMVGITPILIACSLFNNLLNYVVGVPLLMILFALPIFILERFKKRYRKFYFNLLILFVGIGIIYLLDLINILEILNNLNVVVGIFLVAIIIIILANLIFIPILLLIFLSIQKIFKFLIKINLKEIFRKITKPIK